MSIEGESYAVLVMDRHGWEGYFVFVAKSEDDAEEQALHWFGSGETSFQLYRVASPMVAVYEFDPNRAKP